MEKSPMFTPRHEFASRVVIPLTGKRNVPDGIETEVEAKRPAIDSPRERPASPVPNKRKQRKPPNYLRHGDRCCIIKRVADGEPQAALAREFGVTRAAVCQMYKNRAEILSRESEPDQQSPASTLPQPALLQDTRTAVNRPREQIFPHGDSERAVASVLHVPTLQSRSKTVTLLLRTLQDERTNSVDSRRAAARLTLCVVLILMVRQVRDAVCSFINGPHDKRANVEHAGQIHVKAEPTGGYMNWQLEYLDVPDNIMDFEVLLFSTSANGGAECKAIEVAMCPVQSYVDTLYLSILCIGKIGQALRRIGVLECRICLVMAVCSTHGYEKLSARYPRVKIISAAIGDEWTLQQGLHPQSVGPSSHPLVPNELNVS
ncbi:Phosphoribosyltransferase-like [Phytophthora cactorum]|nr:Phosphoribosyltransferase-like [Phytophthora cactorum]